MNWMLATSSRASSWRATARARSVGTSVLKYTVKSAALCHSPLSAPALLTSTRSPAGSAIAIAITSTVSNVANGWRASRPQRAEQVLQMQVEVATHVERRP